MATSIRARLVQGLASTMWLALLGTACQRDAAAQPVDDPLGPIGCFEIVHDKNLSEQSGIELCAGATSVAPGQCYVATLDRHHELSTQKIVQLCHGATSLDPLDCYERLEAIGTMTEDQIIGYCAPRCPLGPAPPQASHPACVAAAVERTQLALQTIGQLCASSRSAGPVACFIVGQRVSSLAESQLVQLCVQGYSCQYINALPPEGS